MAELDMGEFGTLQIALEELNKNHKRITSYDTPWWGNKSTQSGAIENRGYVIGFQDTPSASQWRLDYDPIKKLHINWSQTVHNTTSKECYRISSICPESTLWDLYVGWTRPRIDDLPSNVKQLLGSKTWNGRAWVD